MSLNTLNTASEAEARHIFMQCCTSEAWVDHMVQNRPYASVHALAVAGNQHWSCLQEEDYLQAFEGHPKIGDVESLSKKYRNTKELASGEQSLVKEASKDVLHKLIDGNAAYETKFGFIFIVCATGKSAQQMLSLLEYRLSNDRPTELVNAAEEQRKILQLRLEKLL
ncbi:2-oxo-4-hydroxy-4-carboxy-5-ureidoimidazoline decarboxylase [Porticoccus sp. W117]|uniref:2-oxo-4-hydroxy-4-carboxy-5-ureidoimidazoline decarboxylase n=1 Tax=Porticoccus sp. W117 TaxID=3054777 RepID=UPI0025957196|nr:2-oxo-4-hydroxy-4-carboxy-5-ureidoimidazoline decarboxylase [Porticoccus sp. W117]MDM3872332.1 2-oxo-4-hydroxy-4-carboxy-5-ureidoimidazoline decarboxylase [Porticoccus sp. W117]